MKRSTKITIALAALAILAMSLVGMYFIGTMNGKVEVKTQLTVNENAAYAIAKLATYEQTGTVTFHYTNKVDEEGTFFNQAKSIAQNFLFERSIDITGYYIASYGVVLDSSSSYVQPDVSANEVYITLPEPQLLFYQTPDDSLHPRKIIEDNGALVLERNATVRDMESRWYMQGRDEAMRKQENIDGAKRQIVKVFEAIYSGPNVKKVFVKFEKNFKGYEKIPLQNQ